MAATAAVGNCASSRSGAAFRSRAWPAPTGDWAGSPSPPATDPSQRCRACSQHSIAASVKVAARLVMRCTTYSTEVSCSGCRPQSSAQNSPTVGAISPAPSRRARRPASAYTSSTFSRWMARLLSLKASG